MAIWQNSFMLVEPKKQKTKIEFVFYMSLEGFSIDFFLVVLSYYFLKY